MNSVFPVDAGGAGDENRLTVSPDWLVRVRLRMLIWNIDSLSFAVLEDSKRD
jgi:hypothetical protein